MLCLAISRSRCAIVIVSLSNSNAFTLFGFGFDSALVALADSAPSAVLWPGSRVPSGVAVQVTNLHVRYEDSVTRPGSTFACGVTLHSMGAFTVDEAGKEMFVKKAAMALLRKAAALSRFAVYFDTGARVSCLMQRSCQAGTLHMWSSSWSDSCRRTHSDCGCRVRRQS